MSLLSKLPPRKFLLSSIIILCIFTSLIFLLISSSSNENPWKRLIKNNFQRRPRILCLVTTQPKNHNSSAQAIKATWGRKCDILYFVSSQADPSLPAVKVQCEKDDHAHLWCKNRKGIMHGVDKYEGQFDWFLKTDDDTFIIMENLWHLLSQHDPNEAIWFGCVFALGGDRNITYMSGGAGYAMSRKAITELNKEFKHLNKCKDINMGETGADDVELGRCLNKLGVRTGDSRDELKRNRFFPFMAGDFVNPNYNAEEGLKWFGTYNVYHNKKGFNCCSDTTISFHYLSSVDQYVYEFLIYHLNVNKAK